MPSIPLAPRLESTRGGSSRTAANVSTSRTGIDEATTSVASGGSSAVSVRASAGSLSSPASVRSIASRGARVRVAPGAEPGRVADGLGAAGERGRDRDEQRGGILVEREVADVRRVLPRGLRVDQHLDRVERREPLTQRLRRRQVAGADTAVGLRGAGERRLAQQRVVVRDRAAAAARAGERVGEHRPAGRLAERRGGRRERRRFAAGAARSQRPSTSTPRPAERTIWASDAAPCAASLLAGERTTHGRPSARPPPPGSSAGSSPSSTSGSRSGKLRCTGPGRSESAVQTARQASARIQRSVVASASWTPTSANILTASP